MKNDDLFSYGNNDINSSEGMEDLSSNGKSDVFDLNSFANVDVEPDEIEKYHIKSSNKKNKKWKYNNFQFYVKNILQHKIIIEDKKM